MLETKQDQSSLINSVVVATPDLRLRMIGVALGTGPSLLAYLQGEDEYVI